MQIISNISILQISNFAKDFNRREPFVRTVAINNGILYFDKKPVTLLDQGHKQRGQVICKNSKTLVIKILTNHFKRRINNC